MTGGETKYDKLMSYQVQDHTMTRLVEKQPNVGSMAMGFAFAFLGMAYLDRPVLGLIISALIPLAVWPFAHRMLRRPAEQPVVTVQPQPDAVTS